MESYISLRVVIWLRYKQSGIPPCPLLGGKGLNIRQLKLAMGLKATKGKKYEINKILPRHFLDTAKAVNFSQDKMQRIMDEMKGALPEAISQVKANLPEGFPEHISNSIFENAKKKNKKI
ncbi:hypothetical protein [Shewanella algae]|uniref:hypothetical protein n=2 Tax=Shewanella algae TaxID=38313 RepID=UPI00399BC25D